ncbi:MAG: GNAT family N-acetyltransferase [Defluviitaleaceae bacterium]|nr:GNAT family N-acetyltransferase [Defluviitaleaceae bacterium]
MLNTALEYLNKTPLFHMDMIVPIMRGTADIIYASSDGVFLKELESGAFKLSVSCLSKGKELIDSVEQEEFCFHQKPLFEYMKQKYDYSECLICFQAVYNKKECIRLNTSRLSIRQLTVNYADIVYENYHYVDYDYIVKRLKNGAIYGGFLGDELCGFIGIHAEGSMGMLEVFQKHRQKGFAVELEAYMLNEILKNGQIPFGQIAVDNEPSIKLHKKLGFDISTDEIYWLF